MQAAEALGDPFELMRRAGLSAWRELLACWPAARELLVVCGPGNNGGDGYLLGANALASGRPVQVIALAPPSSPLAARARERYESLGGGVASFDGAALPPADVIVDALFGIGLDRAPQGAAAELIDAINRHAAPVIALDVPSGLDASRGSAAGAVVRAARTIEFIGPKQGLRTGDALDACGALACADLGAAQWRDAQRVASYLASSEHLANWLPPRLRNGHKGLHGRVLCIGGDTGMGGAVLLCAEAALRSGAGLVDVATRAAHVAALLARRPEAMARACECADDMHEALVAADCIAIGPGLGQGAWGEALLRRAIASGKPLVLDADALNLVAAHRLALPAEAVITPHPGEAARLLGTDTRQVQRDRFDAVCALVRQLGCAVVLKGAGTLVAAPGQEPVVIEAGNPGMGVGGMGDLLTGVIAALRAQGLGAFDAAVCGALLHSVAGDAAAAEGERGLLPGDLLPWLRRHANPELRT